MLRIEPGVTTRTDVLMTLGEPDRRLEEDRYFVYEWSRTHAIVGVIVAGGYQAGVLGPVALGDRNALALEFGPDARVTRVKTFTLSMQGGKDVGDERATTEQLLWEDVDEWMNAAGESAPAEAK